MDKDYQAEINRVTVTHQTIGNLLLNNETISGQAEAQAAAQQQHLITRFTRRQTDSRRRFFVRSDITHFPSGERVEHSGRWVR